MAEQSIGARIAALRNARGMSGERLGVLIGLTKSQVSKVENGTRKLDVSEVALVADALGVTLAEVLGVARNGSLALAARIMSETDHAEALPARRRIRQTLEVEAALADAVGLIPARPSAAGAGLLAEVRGARTSASAAAAQGAQLADEVRSALGLGRGPIADLVALCERHFGLSVLLWPIGTPVSGLCAHGDGVALCLASTSFPPGHQRFTVAHGLAHHILEDPREIIVESDLFAVETPAEKRANSFAAALLMPADGLREIMAGRPIDASVLAELVREFMVSYRALLYRLADRSVRLLTPALRDVWLNRSATSVLREAGDVDPAELTSPDHGKRVPARLWQAAQHGYEAGRVGIGVLSALLDENAEELFIRLGGEGINPPILHDNLDDL
ncbi:MAG TPA: XRE family transcriptional regulator [Actinocrinis sp.]|nr:XRE family transcriptional regulator [Actinocrinis sp.]